MEKYLRMSDVFNGEVLVSNSTAYTLKSELDRLYRVREVNDDTLMCSGSDVAEYAAHAINTHDELVAMNKDLLAALEWSDSQIMEFISIAFRHAQIKGDFELPDVRDALNMIVAKAKAAS